MISADGRALRSVVVAGSAALEVPTVPPVFSADGTRLVIPYLARDSITQQPTYAVAEVRSGPARRLSLSCGSTPSLSPDGKLLACPALGGDQVSVADLSGEVRFTVRGKAALWSADGRLAVARAKQTEVVSAAGRSLAKLSGVARAWSPDGRTLALTRPGALVLARPGRPGAPHVVYRADTGRRTGWPSRRTAAPSSFAGGLGEPQMAAVSGGRVRAFAGLPFGDWSRDGRYAFLACPPRGVAVAIGDQLTRTSRFVARLPYDDQGVSGLAWLGDGSAVLVNGSAQTRADLWTMRADGSGQRRLTGTFSAARPAWSADGARLAYTFLGQGDASIFVAGADGRKLSTVKGARPGEASSDGNPSWSPDGKRIAVDEAGSGGVSVVDVATGARTALAVDGVSPAWSPDGQTVAFVDLDDGTVWGASPSGADRRRLLPASVREVRSIAWSPDGKRLAFSTAAGVSIAAADGLSAPRLVTAARAPSRPSFSPDGLRLAFAADVGTVHGYRAVFVVGSDGQGRTAAHDGPLRQLRSGLAAVERLSRTRGRGGRACRAAPAASRPPG